MHTLFTCLPVQGALGGRRGRRGSAMSRAGQQAGTCKTLHFFIEGMRFWPYRLPAQTIIEHGVFVLFESEGRVMAVDMTFDERNATAVAAAVPVAGVNVLLCDADDGDALSRPVAAGSQG